MNEETGPAWDAQPFKAGDMVIAKDAPHLWGEVKTAGRWGDLTIRWRDGWIAGAQAYEMRPMTPLEALASV